MDIESMTLKELRQVAEVVARMGISASGETPWPIGKNVLIRTVTMIQVGKLVAVTDQELVLEDAAWVADTGRFAQCLSTGSVGECEPFPVGKVFIGRGAIIDACEWAHPLLRVVK